MHHAADHRTSHIPANDGRDRRFQCRHIFTDGRRCGSPCLRHQDFCYYHHTARRRQAIPTQDLSQGEHRNSAFTLPVPEDRSAIQAAIAEILNRLAANELDPRRAGLMLYGLQIASLNLPRAAATQPATQPGELVEEIVTDPHLGTVAPRSEVVPPPDAEAHFSLARLLLEECRREKQQGRPEGKECHPEEQEGSPVTDARPATLPSLDAAAETQPTRAGKPRACRNPLPSSPCEILCSEVKERKHDLLLGSTGQRPRQIGPLRFSPPDAERQRQPALGNYPG